MDSIYWIILIVDLLFLGLIGYRMKTRGDDLVWQYTYKYDICSVLLAFFYAAVKCAINYLRMRYGWDTQMTESIEIIIAIIVITMLFVLQIKSLNELEQHELINIDAENKGLNNELWDRMSVLILFISAQLSMMILIVFAIVRTVICYVIKRLFDLSETKIHFNVLKRLLEVIEAIGLQVINTKIACCSLNVQVLFIGVSLGVFSFFIPLFNDWLSDTIENL